MKLRSVELAIQDPAGAARFLIDVWGLAEAEMRPDAAYLRGSGGFPYLLALTRDECESVRSTTFTCDSHELASLEARVTAAGWPVRRVTSVDPGGGEGVLVQLPEGELLRFLVGAGTVNATDDVDAPVQLTHVVINSVDAAATARAVSQVLGFRVSDRTRAMEFVRCNSSHHSIAFARAGFSSLNHIAFEMRDLDAVMRGVGRMRDHQFAPAWGPGRHGPGANVFAYYIAPFGPVIEYSTAVDKVADDYPVGQPEDWTWPPNRIDRWGISDKDTAGLRIAEERFRFDQEWRSR